MIRHDNGHFSVPAGQSPFGAALGWRPQQDSNLRTPLDFGAIQRRSHRGRTPPLPGPHRPTRRDKITAIITSQPPRDWSGHELAVLLGVKPRNMLTQLGQWNRLGFFTRTGSGTYQLNTPPAQTSSTPAPDP